MTQTGQCSFCQIRTNPIHQGCQAARQQEVTE